MPARLVRSPRNAPFAVCTIKDNGSRVPWPWMARCSCCDASLVRQVLLVTHLYISGPCRWTDANPHLGCISHARSSYDSLRSQPKESFPDWQLYPSQILLQTQIEHFPEEWLRVFSLVTCQLLQGCADSTLVSVLFLARCLVTAMPLGSLWCQSQAWQGGHFSRWPKSYAA